MDMSTRINSRDPSTRRAVVRKYGHSQIGTVVHGKLKSMPPFKGPRFHASILTIDSDDRCLPSSELFRDTVCTMTRKKSRFRTCSCGTVQLYEARQL